MGATGQRGMTKICSLLLFGVTSPNTLAQKQYDHGHGAMQIFDAEGMANTPTWVMVWISFMAICFLSSALFVKQHSEARWVLGAFITGGIITVLSTRLFAMPLLSGYIALIHVVCWTPALIILLTRRPFLGDKSYFAKWSGLMTFVIMFSFVFDIRDAAIFLVSY